MAIKKKPGRKLGSTVVFYTKAENDIIRETITNGKTNKDNVVYLSKKLKRSSSSISQKIIVFKREVGLLRTTAKSNKMSKVNDLRSVVLPKNIALEFEASRCVLKENHIIIYFK